MSARRSGGPPWRDRPDWIEEPKAVGRHHDWTFIRYSPLRWYEPSSGVPRRPETYTSKRTAP